MAIDNAPFVGGFDPNLPLNTDPRAEGAGQIRAVKTALVNTFPNFNGPVTASEADINTLAVHQFQVGMIMMFWSHVPPPNWAFCDGGTYNGVKVPDLRGKFIRTYDGGMAIGATGGTDIIGNMQDYIGVQETALTIDQIPAHSHALPYDQTGSGGGGSGPDRYGSDKHGPQTQQTGKGAAHSHGLYKRADFDNRPAFAVMSYICFVGAPK